ncbi:AraC family transcriptional regulator [Azotosporobacter soli]|uniref:AraC family transcriptional regulator n=1 Tax=Azotosporobacter soli TaxID=3055040 RepID=UPI0031FEC409
MNEVNFYRDAQLPFEIKINNKSDALSYKKHAHEEYSLGLVNQGASSFWCQGRYTELGPKSLVFIPRELVHACNPKVNCPWAYKMIYLQAPWLKDFLASCKMQPALLQKPLVRTLAQKNDLRKANQLIERLLGSVSYLEKESALQLLLEELLCLRQVEVSVKEAEMQPKVKKIREHLLRNLADKTTLQQLEEVSGLNKFHIIRAFKAEFGIPPHAYQTLLRINQAKKELRKNKAISAVAYETGFYDQSHFHKTFKLQVGVTPECYQKTALGKRE